MPFNEDGTRKNTMAYKKGRAKSSTFQMKGNPMQRNFGIGSPLHNEERVLTPEEEETRQARINEEANKRNWKKAQELYVGDRGSRTGGTDLSKADKETQLKYRAMAQNT